MNWMHIVGFLLMLGGFLTIFESLAIALLLIAVGAILFQCGINKATAQKREQEEMERERIKKSYSFASFSTPNTNTKFTANNQTHHTAPSYNMLDTFTRYSIFAPSVYEGCPMIYKYPNVSVSNVDKDALCSIVQAKSFDVSLIKCESGTILLQKDNHTVATLEDKIQMVTDWLDKGFSVRCEFVAFKSGKEKVALYFYKDEEAMKKTDKCEIVKLISCYSASKQETIAFLEQGEKLFIDTDDNGKPYLRDINYSPVGNLPAKYNRLYEEDLISGIFFDHTEKKEVEDIDKDDKEIPFVRVYISE